MHAFATFLIQAALKAPSPFLKQTRLDQDLQQAIEWIAARSATQVLHLCCGMLCFAWAQRQVKQEREQVISAIEEAGQELWKSGAVANWYADADRQVAAVSRTVNGPLLEYLAEVHDYLSRSLALLCVLQLPGNRLRGCSLHPVFQGRGPNHRGASLQRQWNKIAGDAGCRYRGFAGKGADR